MASPRVPAPVSGVDVLSLPLNTTEGFVLSRVDGSSSVDDISMMSGIDKSKLLAILERLAELGAVRLSWYQPPRKPEPKAAPKPAKRAAPDGHFAATPPRYLSSELDAPGDIPVELKRRILNAYYGLEGRNLYELLGVERSADRASIRAAYFELSKTFHPDSQFGKQLYSFKPKMEAVFKKLTEAYEVLGKKKKRTEYDEYLGTTERTQGIQDTLEAAEQVADSLRRSSEIPRPPEVTASAVASEAPADSAAARRASRRAPRSNAERRARVRDSLRKKLKHASTPPPPPLQPRREREPAAPVEEPAKRDERRQSVIEGLRSSIRAGATVSGGGTPDDRIVRHLKRAREAESGGDVLAAASELQLAMALDTQNADLKREYERVSQAVAAQLAENYEKQAHYEEKTGNWKAAASSWARVAEGRPLDAEAARSAANALLKASGDLHRARKYAEQATRIAPGSVLNLVVLARVYLAAGLKLNAKRELERAAKLDPNDEIVKNLLRDAG